MPEHVYLFVVAGCFGLTGGFLARLIVAAHVQSMESQAGEVSTSHEWTYAGGGRSAATWADVWRHTGWGPQQEGAVTSWVCFLAALGITALACFFPPPMLATGRLVPFFTWGNICLPTLAFLLSYALGYGLFGGLAGRNEWAGCFLLVAPLPGLVLLLGLLGSYLFGLSWFLAANAFYVSLGLAVALLVCVFITGFRSEESQLPIAPALVAFLYLGGLAAIGVALSAPRFSPLEQLLRDEEPGDGLPGPQGEPPLQLKELEPPFRLLAAGGTVNYPAPEKGTVVHVLIEDAAGTRVQFCLARDKTSISDPFKQPTYTLHIGGTHPSSRSTRLPLSDDEPAALADALRRVLEAAQADGEKFTRAAQGQDVVAERGHRDEAKPASPADVRRWQLTCADEARRRLGSLQPGRFANEVELVGRVYELRSIDLEAALASFRQAKPEDRMAKWEQLVPGLAAQLRTNPPTNLRDYLTEALGPPDPPPTWARFGQRDRSWEQSPPDGSTLLYRVGASNDQSQYIEIDVRKPDSLDYRWLKPSPHLGPR
jgi:hypothetical protein